MMKGGWRGEGGGVMWHGKWAILIVCDGGKWAIWLVRRTRRGVVWLTMKNGKTGREEMGRG
jgi:hypothetical protein